MTRPAAGAQGGPGGKARRAGVGRAASGHKHSSGRALVGRAAAFRHRGRVEDLLKPGRKTVFHGVGRAPVEAARAQPGAEGRGIGFLHGARHAYGPHDERAGVILRFGQQQSGLGRLKRDRDVGAHGRGRRTAVAGGKPGRHVHGKHKGRGKGVQLFHKGCFPLAQLTVKPGAEQRVHHDVGR